MKYVFNARPQPDLLPQEKEQQLLRVFCLRMTVRHGQSREFSGRTENDSPSSGGEGRDEGGRCTLSRGATKDSSPR